VAAALCIVAALYTFGAYRQLPSTPTDYRDFKAYYLPGLQLLRGMNPYLATYPAGTPIVADTPAWLMCFQPLAALTPYTAYWTWFWINVSALMLSIWLLIRESDIRGPEAVSVAALLWMYPPLATNFWFAQSEVFLLLPLVLMLVALRRNHDRLAGLSLAAATLLRAYPLGLVGYLLVLRRWKALGWTGVGLLIGGVVTILLVGWEAVAAYSTLIGVSRGSGLFGLSTTLNIGLGMVKHPANLNLGWFVKWLYDRKPSQPLPVVVTILAALAEISAVIVCFWATRNIRADDPDWRGFGLWIVTISLLSPLSWYFFLCCFLPMLAGMAAAWRRQELSRPVLYAITASYLVTTLFPSYGHPIFPIWHAAMLAAENSHHLHIVHVFTETEFTSLALAWFAAFWFVTTARENTGSVS